MFGSWLKASSPVKMGQFRQQKEGRRYRKSNTNDNSHASAPAVPRVAMVVQKPDISDKRKAMAEGMSGELRNEDGDGPDLTIGMGSSKNQMDVVNVPIQDNKGNMVGVRPPKGLDMGNVSGNKVGPNSGRWKRWARDEGRIESGLEDKLQLGKIAVLIKEGSDNQDSKLNKIDERLRGASNVISASRSL
ncbi:hypothetical protein LWI28_025320 [Acer negundo]|uniref:Uncharacterized protein n=1 Tax=Acer negundo TaxID=4023 RepID=A0AAD5JJA3_ACENE|nr:hypothetical protein LWI28_025320 [Acer negundo]